MRRQPFADWRDRRRAHLFFLSLGDVHGSRAVLSQSMSVQRLKRFRQKAKLIAIRTEFPEARIIMLTTFEGDVEIRRALEAGARAYMLKEQSEPRDSSAAFHFRGDGQGSHQAHHGKAPRQ